MQSTVSCPTARFHSQIEEKLCARILATSLHLLLSFNCIKRSPIDRRTKNRRIPLAQIAGGWLLSSSRDESNESRFLEIEDTKGLEDINLGKALGLDHKSTYSYPGARLGKQFIIHVARSSIRNTKSLVD